MLKYNYGQWQVIESHSKILCQKLYLELEMHIGSQKVMNKYIYSLKGMLYIITVIYLSCRGISWLCYMNESLN